MSINAGCGCKEGGAKHNKRIWKYGGNMSDDDDMPDYAPDDTSDDTSDDDPFSGGYKESDENKESKKSSGREEKKSWADMTEEADREEEEPFLDALSGMPDNKLLKIAVAFSKSGELPGTGIAKDKVKESKHAVERVLNDLLRHRGIAHSVDGLMKEMRMSSSSSSASSSSSSKDATTARVTGVNSNTKAAKPNQKAEDRFGKYDPYGPAPPLPRRAQPDAATDIANRHLAEHQARQQHLEAVADQAWRDTARTSTLPDGSKRVRSNKEKYENRKIAKNAEDEVRDHVGPTPSDGEHNPDALITRSREDTRRSNKTRERDYRGKPAVAPWEARKAERDRRDNDKDWLGRLEDDKASDFIARHERGMDHFEFNKYYPDYKRSRR